MSLDGLPNSWRYDPDNIFAHEDAFYSSFEEKEEQYKHNGVKSRFLLTKDRSGNRKFHSRQYPSPDDSDPQARAVSFIAMEKPQEPSDTTRRRMVDRVPLNQVSQHEAQGWRVWDHPPTLRRTDPEGVEIDSRLVERVDTVLTTDAPYKDTMALFEREIDVLRVGGNGKWYPGKILNLTPTEAQASISFAPSFLPTSCTLGQISATSNGHVPMYPRPAGVGLGWE